MKIVNINEARKLFERGKNFNDLINKEKIQDFMNNFYQAYNNFYNSNLPDNWYEGLNRSKEFISYYRKCEKEIKKDFYKTVLSDSKFQSDLYKTVKSWVKMCPFGGSKLKSPSNFYKTIQEITDDLEQIKEITLESLVKKGEKLSQTEGILKSIFEKLETADQSSQLVPNSKTLFHLLPDLIMPVDREHVLSFFIGYDRAHRPIPKKKETEYFIGIFDYYYEICKKNLTQIKDIYYKKRKKYDSSMPKIIDNAICGYNARS